MFDFSGFRRDEVHSSRRDSSDGMGGQVASNKRGGGGEDIVVWASISRKFKHQPSMTKTTTTTTTSQTVSIPGTQSQIIIPTFDTKVTEYLCSGWVFFFFRQVSTFYLAIFDGIFFLSFERYCCPELKLEKIFHL